MLDQSLPALLSAAGAGAWANHPSFAGVRLRQLVGRAETDGRFSTHLVDIQPGCRLEAHRHPAQVEQHLVLAGDGVLTSDGSVTEYRAGRVSVIPQDIEHSVEAGPGGMMIVAVFAPALG
jgi:quercetin dioxygenase-like cupin family protein